ncbi:TPA: hypothetical protein GE513_17040 [Escherichia coli]|nr:hypothetical protein [Escherichia coli]THJ08714.1 hypothetical protein FAZ83_19790 [Escherichia coli K-12]EFB1247193.1 hypothetical protein [Escherichia coli]EFO0941376.1 hypothetical protein [Escherichia coli]EGD9826113.1 hypothetical protein [Escherichia coli]
MPEIDSLKHPLQFYLTLLFPQTVFIPSGKSNTPPAPPPSQFLPLLMLQASSLIHLLRRFW